MQKIISLFQRNYETDYLVRDEVVPGAEWVLAGEGVATRKYDGTCCLVRAGHLFKRYELRAGKQPPEGFEPADEPDPETRKQPGWVPVGEGPEDRWHREAFHGEPNGAYELCGPKVQGNPEEFVGHILVLHGSYRLYSVPRTFHELKAYFSAHDVEGIVWHHQDGRMVKIKAKDFGLKRSGLDTQV